MNMHESLANDAELAAYLSNLMAMLQQQLRPAVTEDNARQRLDEGVALLGRLVAGLRARDGSTNGPGSDAPAQRLQWEAGQFARLQQQVDELITHTRDSQEEGDAAKLSGDDLATYLQVLQNVDRAQVDGLVQLAGGRSKRTFLFSQSGVAQWPAELVLRQDWSGVVDGSVRQEYALLKELHGVGLKVPKVLHLEREGAQFGGPFMILERVAGRGRGTLWEPPRQRQLAEDVAVQLGQLHGLPVQQLEAFRELPERAYRRGQLREELDEFSGMIQQLSKPSAALELALVWLEQHVDRIEGPSSLVHGDLGFHNFLATDTQIEAILDWELAHLGNPAEDLGYIRPWVELMMPWSDFLDLYRQAGGPHSSELTIDFYTIWAGVRICWVLMRARAGLVTQAVEDFELTVIAGDLLHKVMGRLATDLSEILERQPLAETAANRAQGA